MTETDFYLYLMGCYNYLFELHFGKTMLSIHMVLFLYLRVKLKREKSALELQLAKKEVEIERLNVQISHFDNLAN